MKEKPNFADAVVEDYVKVIYSHTEWQPEPITTSVLAARLGLAPSSVTEMVKKLAVSGLATHVPYGAVTLTEEGRALALRMLRRHRLIETWLVESFGYGWDEVHDEAEVLEHALSDRLLERIAHELGDPVRDPHGDPIPRADGTVEQPDAVLLQDAPDGFSGPVVRISDRAPELLKHLHEEGVALDTVIEVVERRPFGGALSIRTPASALDLGVEATAAIWLAL
ncbi:manganese-binding transcriptional regulator MntR [Leifsonia bigeumensis]|uniref:Manganese transport regulator n=1 Tax=Leifsonella bigeumensis TaxID=433643 RepID=A0ABP7FWL0_9MICO